MGSARDAVDISSDEEDFRRLSAGPLGWVSKLFDNTVVIDESPPQPKKMSKSAGAGEDGDGDDCVVLERDPDGPVSVAAEKRAAADAASDEVEIVAVKGQIAYKETKWKTLRKASKFKSLAASHPEREPNVLYQTVSSPRHQGYDEDYTSEDYTSDDEEEYFELADEEEYFEEDDEARVYVGNLPHATDSEYLAQLFKQAGTVESSEIIYNRETGQSRRFGFITMSTVEQAEKAVDIFHCGDLDGRLLAVKKAATPRTSRVYVGNLPWYVDHSRLKRLFSEYGDVVDAEVVYHYRRGAWRSQGFGFVTMVRREEAENAIWNLDGQDWRGRELRVEAAKDERPRRGS